MNQFANCIPPSAPSDICQWAVDSEIKVDGHSFDPSLCPQAVKPMQAMSLADKQTRIGTFIKPVQSGGSTAGEVVVAYWAKFAYGMIQENWQDDQKAAERWKDRILPNLESAGLPWAGGRDSLVCEARFEKTTLRVQGVFNENALNSDTIPYQKNEEVHLWKPGHLAMARDRQTRIWNSKAFDISNASRTGTQLHSAFEDGTMEPWETKCPKCRVSHAMHFRYNPSKPELGGLRWDASTRLADGRPNYTKLEKTIRYQFPCGHEALNDPASRRTLKGDYGEPMNPGAHISHRSWISEAVSYDQIPWLTLIKEWHGAIRAIKTGDTEPMFRFVTRRECKFFSDTSLPFHGNIVTTSKAVVNRTGLENEAAKIFAFDWQQGFKNLGELTHYWGVIESVMADCSSQVIWAGKVDDEMELLTTLRDHGITDADGGGIFDGFIDASKNTKHILSFCYRSGINAVMGNASGKGSWKWPDGSYQYYSPKKYIYKELNMPPKHELRATREGYVEDSAEPFIIMYSKAGILKNHFFIREFKANVLQNNPKAAPDEYIERIIPADIGDDYLNHHEAWERDLQARGVKKMGEVEGFKQTRRADHLMSCTCYIDLCKDLTGLIGGALRRLGIERQKTNQSE